MIYFSKELLRQRRARGLQSLFEKAEESGESQEESAEWRVEGKSSESSI